jgi:hypothetical protein
MTSAYRIAKLTEAETGYADARRRVDAARTKKARREAAEDVEFWGNKVAFLSNPNLEARS